MRYMGGKHRQSKQIVKELVKAHDGEKIYIEPFCGALGVAWKAIPILSRLGVENFVLADQNDFLITMWHDIIYKDWTPPEFVGYEEYYKFKDDYSYGLKSPDDPLVAYVGHALSFGGRWFGGYASPNPGQSAFETELASRNSVLSKANALKPYRPLFLPGDYNKLFATEDQENRLFYLDPPYMGKSQGYGYTKEKPFDHFFFWEWAEELAKDNNVLVTEMSAPKQWETIFSWGDTTMRYHHNAGVRDDASTNESIYRLKK